MRYCVLSAISYCVLQYPFLFSFLFCKILYYHISVYVIRYWLLKDLREWNDRRSNVMKLHTYIYICNIYSPIYYPLYVYPCPKSSCTLCIFKWFEIPLRLNCLKLASLLCPTFVTLPWILYKWFISKLSYAGAAGECESSALWVLMCQQQAGGFAAPARGQKSE